MRWVRPQSFLSREAAHERWRAHGCAAVFSAQGLMWHMVVTRGARNCSVAGSAQRGRKTCPAVPMGGPRRRDELPLIMGRRICDRASGCG